MKIRVASFIAAVAGVFAWSLSSAQDEKMSFFITSEGPGDGANLGGLAGADAHCESLAAAVGAGDKIWRAYLSVVAANGAATVNARDRIGTGPWFNHAGLQVADNVDDLHSENNRLGKENSLSETGMPVNGRGDQPNMHDILTGSDADGRVIAGAADSTCSNWTSNAADGVAQVGHHDKQGGGQSPNSWNSAHGSRGCGQANLQGTGGNGLFYCFAID